MLDQKLVLSDSPSSTEGRSPSVADAVSPYLHAQIARITQLDPLVRDDVADAVHDMRVAGRRLRATLASHHAYLDAERARPLRTELSWLVSTLGLTRDLEVLRDGIRAAAGDDFPGLDRLEALLGAEHDEAHRVAVESMRSQRYDELIDCLEELDTQAPWTDRATSAADAELPLVLRREWRRLDKLARQATDSVGSLRAERLHAVRRRARRMRYTAEAAAPVLGECASRLSQELASIQEILGRHHDATIARSVLRDRRDALSAETASMVRHRLAVDAKAADRQFRRAMKELRHSSDLDWLH